MLSSVAYPETKQIDNCIDINIFAQESGSLSRKQILKFTSIYGFSLKVTHPGKVGYPGISYNRRVLCFQTRKYVVRAEDLPRASKLPCAQRTIKRAEFENHT